MLLCSVSEQSAPGSVGQLCFDCRSYCARSRRMQGFIKTRPSPLTFLLHVVQACTQQILPTREGSRRGTGNETLIRHVSAILNRVFVSFPQKRNGIVFSSGVNYLHSRGNIQSGSVHSC